MTEFQDCNHSQELEKDDIRNLESNVLTVSQTSVGRAGEIRNIELRNTEPAPISFPAGLTITSEGTAHDSISLNSAGVQFLLNEQFPRNIFLFQVETVKEREAKKRLETSLGTERGQSFVSSVSYIAQLGNSSTTAGLYNNSLGPKSGMPQPSRVSQSPVASKSAQKSVHFDISTGSDNAEIISPSLQGDFNNKEASQVQQSPNSDPSESLYNPDPKLTQTVNPFLPPSHQLNGSVAYQLKTTEVDKDLSPNPDLSVEIQDKKSPSLQFLRDNLCNRLPVVKGRPIYVSSLTPGRLNNFLYANDRELTNYSLSSKDKLAVPSAYTPPPTPESYNKPVGTLNLTRAAGFIPIPTSGVVSKAAVIPSGVIPASGANQAPPAARMNYIGGTADIYSSVLQPSRVQEKEELQRLNDRFSAYVSRVRQLGQQANSIDTSAFLRSTKILEDEIVNLKNLYETELEKLRNEIEAGSHERNSLHIQHNKQQQSIGELQDRLAIEIDNTSKLMDENNILQRKIGNLQADVQDARMASQRPQENVDQLHRSIENLMREVEQWKHRYDHEQVARQEAEDRCQQILQKMEFSEQVQQQQISDYQSRLDSSAATILSLEARVRDLSKVDVSMAEMLKQVRDTAELELRKYQIESEEQYSRNLSALKAQIDNDADALQRFSQEKSELIGSTGELHAKIRNLEGQVSNLQHQKQTLEEAVSLERTRAADNIRQLEKKLRDVQDMLVVKMREVTNARESNIPLKAEIEALNVLLEEEERRLRVPLGIVPASVVQASVPHPPSTSQILSTRSLNALSAALSNHYQPSGSNFQSLADARKAGALRDVSTPAQSLVPVSKSLAPFLDSNKLNQLPSTAGHLDTSSYPTSYVISGQTPSLYPYQPSPPLDTLYIPETLRSTEEGSPAYDSDYGVGEGCDFYTPEYRFPMTGPNYHYEATPSISRVHVGGTPHAVGPIPNRSKSAPTSSDQAAADKEKNENALTTEKNVILIPATLGTGRDYFDEMFKDLKRDTLFPKQRPKSSPLERRAPSSFQDYNVTTSSAIGDLKVLEVSQDGKYVRLINDGPAEIEFGGYMIQQNVGGHPVAVFRFPPHTKFASDSTITVWAAINDSQLHNPPTDFFWKEQQKWGTGPECTTILCRPNGQAVAWTTAAHRVTKDAFVDPPRTSDTNVSFDKEVEDDEVIDGEGRDDDGLTEFSRDMSGAKPEPVYLRREKQQPPSLSASKHPHGHNPGAQVHPHIGQPRPLYFGNDNSTTSRHSRAQSCRPDPIPGQTYCGASGQRMGSAPLRRMGGNQVPQPPTIRGNGTLVNKSAGSIRLASSSPFLSPLQEQTITETPSPFMKPHEKFSAGLTQVKSQHQPDFLPPMPRVTQTTW
ncbi:unnamed protein product [Lymnaea stagnalis]|uniref:LTD domain-containing protein n=1 Tax=Lymnaea stagnalis TaxID=6523 RepID=A0AAV2HUI7_LYMST